MSMIIDNVIPKSPKSLGDYRFAWVISFAIAVVSAPIIVIYKESAPWAISVPIAIGATIIIAYEYNAAFRLQFKEPNLQKPEGQMEARQAWPQEAQEELRKVLQLLEREAALPHADPASRKALLENLLKVAGAQSQTHPQPLPTKIPPHPAH